MSFQWTTFTESADTVKVYVDPVNGSDSNDGLSAGAAKATIQAGYNLLRHGFPDWLLLCADDGVTHNITAAIAINRSGRSETERMRIGSYITGEGTPGRARVVSTGSHLFTRIGGGGNGTTRGSHLAITGINFSQSARGNQAISWTGGGCRNLLIEDCAFHDCGEGVAITGDSTDNSFNVQIRGCSIYDNYHTSGYQVGLWLSGLVSPTVEGCLIDQNGWAPDITPRDDRSQGIYIPSSTTNPTVKNCILSRSSSHGVQMRPGGTIEDVLCVGCPIGILMGGGDPYPITHTNGVSGDIRGVVVTESESIGETGHRYGIDFVNIGLGGATLTDSIIAHCFSTGGGPPIRFSGNSYGSGVGVNNVAVARCVVYDWRGSIDVTEPFSSPPALAGGVGNSSFTSVSGNTFTDCQFQEPNEGVAEGLFNVPNSSPGVAFSGGTYFSARSASAWFTVGGANQSLAQWMAALGESDAVSEEVSYTDATRTVGSYAGTLELDATREAFLTACRAQTKATWDATLEATAVNAYIRTGFDVTYTAGGGETPGGGGGEPAATGGAGILARWGVLL